MYEWYQPECHLPASFTAQPWDHKLFSHPATSAIIFPTFWMGQKERAQNTAPAQSQCFWAVF